MSSTSANLLGKISTVTIFVRDQDAAKAFYVGKLGMEVRMEMPMDEHNRWLTVAVPGGETEIVLFRDDARAGQGPGLVFGPSDIQRSFEQLAAAGVNFTETPTQQEWGAIQAQFEDQDGNVHVLVQPPVGFGGS